MTVMEMALVPLFWCLFYYWWIYDEQTDLSGFATLPSVIAWTAFAIIHIALLWAVFARGVIARKAGAFGSVQSPTPAQIAQGSRIAEP
jgi:hypothetical protein